VSLPPWSGPVPSVPALGYRGCFVRSGESREWLVYRNVVTLQARGKSESRKDNARRFEKLVLASAPKGMIPASFISNK
jgi:hypothetical protein